ncbi:AMP-binding enzyme family protein (macronuclear) [Tetrahymena thermophila SB210]|uniref:AMP-binding enzyme family protein n=1 Tax=Tetrahymena thermophila (strain SB210) TaxID=312017 RepID=I7MHS7_TETTS|nr:AMP-binding enzyme family protein [Tetrahymena thermophila SB210]EAR89380.1 AMP-binding enzyme family protein [Tetrahymena thermophila SB210]|eukprot:XP_001009625.1 AMP-binding enzyme family protein [Tetrahymena thermophila SB210]
MGGSYSQSHCYAKPISKKKDGETEIYRHPDFLKELLLVPEPGVCTMQDVFLKSAQKYPHQKLLGSRDSQKSEYFWKTYSDCKIFAEQLGNGMIELNLTTHVNEWNDLNMNLVGIFAKNREEWLLLEYANFLYNNTMVPFYDTLGIESISFILGQTNLETIFCSAPSVESLLKCKETHKLKNIVLFDPISQEVHDKVIQRNWNIFNMKDVMAKGKEQSRPYAKVTPEDVLTFSYTSGTTGNPKGVLLTHKNIVSVVATGSNEGFNQSDSYISYLPLPHILERIFVCTFLYYGGSIGFYSGDVMKLKDDLAVLKPTIFVSVPRLYDRFYGAIKSNIEKLTGVKSKLARKALASKTKRILSTGKCTHKLWDRLVFKKSKEALGGRVRWAGTGSAPISGETLTFLKATLCIPIAEGYGQTESCGATFSTASNDPLTGHVGGPRPNYEFKLVDIPDLNYTSLDKDEDGNPAPRGEICVRGNGVFIGYYKEPEKTKEAVDEDGWLHTGDVGQLNVYNGSVKIIDRKKNIFKLAQGEYIAPEKIEGIYIKAKGVSEVFIHGDSLQSACVCIAVPDQKYIMEYAKQNNLSNADNFEALCKSEEIKTHLLQNMTKQGKSENLFGFEQAKAIYLEPKSLVDLDCMTTTFKIKRHQAKLYFSQQIQEMYNQINSVQQPNQ